MHDGNKTISEPGVENARPIWQTAGSSGESQAHLGIHSGFTITYLADNTGKVDHSFTLGFIFLIITSDFSPLASKSYSLNQR